MHSTDTASLSPAGVAFVRLLLLRPRELLAGGRPVNLAIVPSKCC
jgi:hypothetical protein